MNNLDVALILMFMFQLITFMIAITAISMIHKLAKKSFLCFLGMHNWKVSIKEWYANPKLLITYQLRECSRCHKQTKTIIE